MLGADQSFQPTKQRQQLNERKDKPTSETEIEQLAIKLRNLGGVNITH
jgi:hypothetical protein